MLYLFRIKSCNFTKTELHQEYFLATLHQNTHSRRPVFVLLQIKAIFSTNFSRYFLPDLSAWRFLLFYHKELEILALFLANSSHKYFFCKHNNDIIFYRNKIPFNFLSNLYFSLLCIWIELLRKVSALFEMKLNHQITLSWNQKDFYFENSLYRGLKWLSIYSIYSKLYILILLTVCNRNVKLFKWLIC